MPRKLKDKLNLNSEKDVGRSKFIVYGEEMLERVVKLSGNSGRIYLPPKWVGCRVKIIKVK
jgi:putative transposon-encoded protein